MWKLLMAISFALCFGQIAAAQDSPEWQIYGGGSYSHTDVSPPFPGISNINGWGYSVGGEQYVNSWFGGVAEFSDYYRRPTIDMKPFGLPGLKEQVRTHFLYFLAGPQLRHNFGKFTPFGRATIGFSARIVKDQNGFINSDEKAFAFGAGGGVDYRLHRYIALRVFEADYVLTHFDSDRQSAWKVSAGLIFCWGKK